MPSCRDDGRKIIASASAKKMRLQRLEGRDKLLNLTKCILDRDPAFDLPVARLRKEAKHCATFLLQRPVATCYAQLRMLRHCGVHRKLGRSASGTGPRPKLKANLIIPNVLFSMHGLMSLLNHSRQWGKCFNGGQKSGIATDEAQDAEAEQAWLLTSTLARIRARTVVQLDCSYQSEHSEFN